MAHQVRFNLFNLIKRLEQQKRKNVPLRYVAEHSGLSRFTIQKITHNETSRIDLETLNKLLDFFANEGMPMGVGDLFTLNGN